MDMGEPCGKGSDTMNKSISLKTLILVLIVIVVIAACGIGAVIYLNGQKESEKQLENQGGSMMFLPDANAKEGGLDGESLSELYHEMIEKSEKNRIVVNFSETITLADGSSEAEVQIANPVENNYPMQFTIKLEDTGETVYESGLVPLGSHLSSIKLTKDLDAGVYPAVLTYNAFDEEANEIASYVSVGVTITVES